MKLSELIKLWLKNKLGLDAVIKPGPIADTIKLHEPLDLLIFIVYYKNYSLGKVAIYQFGEGSEQVSTWFNHEDPDFFNKLEKILELKL